MRESQAFITLSLHVQQLRKKFSGSLLVESHSPVIPGFSHYFADAILNKTSVAAPLAHQYMESVAHCDAEVSWEGSYVSSILYCK